MDCWGRRWGAQRQLWACGRQIICTFLHLTFSHKLRTGGTKWSKDTRTLIILDMLVLVMGAEIECEIISHFFIPRRRRCRLAKRYFNNVVLRMCCLATPKTLSLSLATDDFIRLYKLFISSRSWKVISTWNKALLWSSSVIPRGGWLFVFVISWQ